MIQKTIKNRTIYCRDNLDILQGINSNSIDIIYLDPPFNKKKIFTAPIDSTDKGASFKDIFREEDIKEEWRQTIKEDNDKLHAFLESIKTIEGRTSYNFYYLAYMAIRLIECHRVLKETGSLYLHCDPTMSHYLKILLDIIFGEKNFRNEIVWKKHGASGSNKSIGNVHDLIFYYVKTKGYKYYLVFLNLTEKDKKEYRYKDEKGLFKTNHLEAQKGMQGGGTLYTYKEYTPKIGWLLKKDKLKEMDRKDYVYRASGGKPRRKYYLHESKGKHINDLWTDFSAIGSMAIERTGYPTQKPLALLERIIRASTDEGDVVLYPFCGCATTCVASEKFGRQWIGIDVSVTAYELVKQRLNNEIANTFFNWNEDIHFEIEPPIRTDEGKDSLLKKHVYVISNESYPNDYKVGIASDVNKRLNSYQTSDPKRRYKIEFSLLTDKFREIEKAVHGNPSFEVRHEWVKGDLKKII